MLNDIHNILQQNCLIDQTKPLLLGISGGPDSLCLLDIMHKLGLSLIIAHVNHGLRQEADNDANQVTQIADELGIPFELGVVNVPEFAKANMYSIEEAARVLRYRFLFTQGLKHNAQAVVVAHTADDQIETVLMHMIRGTGLAGLRGMEFRSLPNPWSTNIPLLRPLLSTWREKIQQYCIENELQPIIDQSNLDKTFFRNRLRLDLIPYLQNFNPAIKRILWRTSQVLNGDFKLIDSLTALAWDNCVVDLGPGYIAYNYLFLKEQSPGLQRHLIRRGIAFLCPNRRDIDFNMIDQAVDFIKHPTQTHSKELALGLRLLAEIDKIWMVTSEAEPPSSDWPQISEDDLNLPQSGILHLSQNWEIQVFSTTLAEAINNRVYANPDPYQTWIDEDKIRSTLKIRHRHSGDRFQPLGMEGKSLKITDFMINVKIPSRARNSWPLVCTDDDILWIPGYQLAHPFRLTQSTKRVLYLRLKRSS